MQIKLKKTAEKWSQLHTEVSILQAGTVDMYLQYICDLILRAIEPTHKAYQEKRTALIKKYGSPEDNNKESYRVAQFEEVAIPLKEGEVLAEGENLPTEQVETANWKAFSAELDPIKNHENELSLECIESEMFRRENPKEFIQLFVRFGYPVGVVKFEQVFEITDKVAQQQQPL
jgi:hypothetical protein